MQNIPCKTPHAKHAPNTLCPPFYLLYAHHGTFMQTPSYLLLVNNTICTSATAKLKQIVAAIKRVNVWHTEPTVHKATNTLPRKRLVLPRIQFFLPESNKKRTQIIMHHASSTLEH